MADTLPASATTERRYVINHRYGVACKDCGARVVDTETHDKFHDDLAETKRKAVFAHANTD